MQSIRVAGARTEAQRFSEAIETLLKWSAGVEQRYVSIAASYTLMMAAQSDAVRAALENADMVTADGMPIVWMQRLLGETSAERVYGPDVLQEVCRLTSKRDDRHFFYGGLEGVPDKLVTVLTSCFPGLKVAGTYSPDAQLEFENVDPATVELLNRAAPNIIWVGLGSPKQDLWMHTYRPHLEAPLLVGVGAAFDFISGTKAQAPRWIRRSGLEWAFRLAHEPHRLWKRYLIYNIVFLIWAVRDLVARHRPR